MAGRDKGLKYVAALLRSRHVKVEVLIERLQTTDATADEFERIIGWDLTDLLFAEYVDSALRHEVESFQWLLDAVGR